MSEDRLTVDELMRVTQEFFLTAIGNIEHDGLLCARCGEPVTVATNPEDCDWRVAIRYSFKGGTKFLMAVEGAVLCHNCMASFQESGRAESAIGSAPAYDELIP